MVDVYVSIADVIRAEELRLPVQAIDKVYDIFVIYII